jgi:hypothetical protein
METQKDSLESLWITELTEAPGMVWKLHIPSSTPALPFFSSDVHSIFCNIL